MLRAITESVLRTNVAGRPFLDLLTLERADMEREVFRLLSKRWEELDSKSLGIELEGLSLIDLHPPSEVVRKYYEVAIAMEERDRTINDAKKEKVVIDKAARIEARQILTRAQADQVEKINDARGATERFLSRSKARQTLDFYSEVQLCLEGVDAVLSGAEPATFTAYERRREAYLKVHKDADFFQEVKLCIDSVDAVLRGKESPVLTAYERRREDALALQAGLTDFRIFWETVSQALKGRDLLLIDAERVPGQRNLMLFDPELMRVPAPLMPLKPNE